MQYDASISHRPQYVELPNLSLDQMLGLTEAELKVLLFVIRQTLGYHRESAKITYSQIMYGIFAPNGALESRGTQLCHKSIGRAVKLLSQKGFIHIVPVIGAGRAANRSVGDPAIPTGTANIYSLGQRMYPPRPWIGHPAVTETLPAPDERFAKVTPMPAGGVVRMGLRHTPRSEFGVMAVGE